MKHILVRAGVAVLCARVLIILLRFGVLLSVVGKFGPSVQGSYAFFLTVCIVGFLFTRTGSDLGFVYFSRNKKVETQRGFTTTIMSSLATSAIVAPAFAVICLVTSNPLDVVSDSLLIWVIITSIGATSVRHHYRYVFLAQDRILAFNLIGFSQPIVVLIGIFLISPDAQSISTLLVYYCIGTMVDIVSCVIVSKEIRFRVTDFDLNLLKRMIRFGLPATINSILITLLLKVDIFILAKYVENYQLGFYTFAGLLADKIFLITEILNPLIFQYLSDKSGKDRWRITKNLFLIFLVVGGVIGLAIYLAAYTFIPLFFPQYTASLAVLAIILPGTFSIAQYHIIHAYFLASDRIMLITKISTITLCLNIILNILIVPSYGIWGAAYVTLTTYSFLMLTSLAIFIRDGKNNT